MDNFSHLFYILFISTENKLKKKLKTTQVKFK